MLPQELKFLFDGITEPTPKLRVGDVIFFGYNSLESFYDRFPMVLILSIRKRQDEYNIFGMNLHFIPPEFRLLFLDIMSKSNGDLTKTTKTVNENIPRRFLLNSFKSYNVSNVLTNIKAFKNNEINKIINIVVPDYGPQQETNIIKYLDKVFIMKRNKQ